MLKAAGFCSIFVLWAFVGHAEGQTCGYLGMCPIDPDCDRPWCQRIQMVPCRITQPCTNEWNSWNRCNRPCGGGMRTRSGLCRGEQCGRIIRESEDCNTQACPGQVDGGWSEWSPWIAGSCSESCCGGSYSQTRSRTCTDPAPMGRRGKPCEGDAEETMVGMKCSMEGCPMSCENKTVGTAFPDNCGMCSRRFFACDGDVMPTEFSCPENYYYNENADTCEPDSNCFGLP